jgi:hypothetical protein
MGVASGQAVIKGRHLSGSIRGPGFKRGSRGVSSFWQRLGVWPRVRLYRTSVQPASGM